MIELVLMQHWRDWWGLSFVRPDSYLPEPGAIGWVLRFGPLLIRYYRKA